jgi:hypothetical protein
MRALLTVAVLAGCSGGALPAGAIDLAVAGSGVVGAACAAGGECATGTCFTGAPFKNGYCSRQIPECPAPGGTGDPCPAGSICINPGIAATGGIDYCLKSCTANSDCRQGEGYRCCPWSGAGVCATVCP